MPNASPNESRAVSLPVSVENRVVARQVQLNRGSSKGWESFGPHRRRVTELILGGGRSVGGRLCVLGAGNCNDLDLSRLAGAFSSLHLVDLDGDALERAARRRPVPDRIRVVLNGGIDLGGIAGRLAALRPETASEPEIDELIQQAAKPSPADLGGPFDVAASTCLLTQLMNSAVDGMGESHSRLPEMLAAIRTAHVRLLGNMVAPGGSGLLITDVASTDACEQIATAGDAELPRLERQIAKRDQFFLGADPGLIEDQLRTDVYLGSRIETVERSLPWRWRITSRRVYLVVGFFFRVARVSKR